MNEMCLALGDAYRKLRSLVEAGVHEPKIMIITPTRIGAILASAEDLYAWPKNGRTKDMAISLISHSAEQEGGWWRGTMGETDREWDVRLDMLTYHECPAPLEFLDEVERWRIGNRIQTMQTSENFWELMREFGYDIVKSQVPPRPRPYIHREYELT